jgi:hypothetical protein
MCGFFVVKIQLLMDIPDMKELEAETAYAAEQARLEAAENLTLEARRDGVKDVEREAKIDELESAGDLVEGALKDRAVGAFRGERKTADRKINPVRMDKRWYGKTERTQRRIMQKKLGSYRPEPDDPVNQKPHAKAVVEGSLFDLHPLSRVRKRDVEATGTIRAAIPTPLPIKPPPAPAPPEEGRCWECYLPIRKSGKNKLRAGTNFCTDNMGECRKAYNSREADRAALNQIFKDWSDSRHGDRMLSIHRLAAEAMSDSADRCGIKDVTFVADPDGVLAVHANPLPPIVHCLTACEVLVAAGDGYAMLHVEVIATEVDGGTLYTFETDPPEGNAQIASIKFEGDPGREYVEYVDPNSPGSPLPPVTSTRQAIVTNRVTEFMAARRRDLAA